MSSEAKTYCAGYAVMLKTGAVATALNLGRPGNMIGNNSDRKMVVTGDARPFLIFEYCPACSSKTDNGIAQCDEPLTKEMAEKLDEASELTPVGVGD